MLRSRSRPKIHIDDRLKEEAEMLISKTLNELETKLILDPNFHSLQNIAVIINVFPKSPAHPIRDQSEYPKLLIHAIKTFSLFV